MQISASVKSSLHHHETNVATNGASKEIAIASKESGYGSSVNGGELLLLALATCFCNDIYREAAKRNIAVTHVKVEVNADFGATGEAGKNFIYRANVTADASDAEIAALIRETDKVAEIQNTLRKGVKIDLV